MEGGDWGCAQFPYKGRLPLASSLVTCVKTHYVIDPVASLADLVYSVDLALSAGRVSFVDLALPVGLVSLVDHLAAHHQHPLLHT